MRLIDVPNGSIFRLHDDLVLKTEYFSRVDDVYIPDCYIIDTGEKFWGGMKTKDDFKTKFNDLEVEVINVLPDVSDTSSDTISRQSAIDALDKRFDNIPMEQTAEILKLRKDLRELPTIQPEPQWIPVSERLPESGTYCLFTVFEHDSELEATTIETVYGCFHDYGERRYWSWEDEVGECCIEGEEQLDGYHDEIIEKVLAWMPLSKPYKPNKKQSGKEGA